MHEFSILRKTYLRHTNLLLLLLSAIDSEWLHASVWYYNNGHACRNTEVSPRYYSNSYIIHVRDHMTSVCVCKCCYIATSYVLKLLCPRYHTHISLQGITDPLSLSTSLNYMFDCDHLLCMVGVCVCMNSCSIIKQEYTPTRGRQIQHSDSKVHSSHCRNLSREDYLLSFLRRVYIRVFNSMFCGDL